MPPIIVNPFSTIIAGLNSGDNSKSLARVILALQTLAAPSPSTPVVAGVDGYPAYSGAGVKGFFDSFKLIPGGTSTDYHIELPYSPKLLGRFLDTRKSIVKLPIPPNTLPVIRGFTVPVVMPSPPATLELFCYDLAVLLEATIAPKIEPLTGRTYLLITGTISQTMDILLSDPTNGGGMQP